MNYNANNKKRLTVNFETQFNLEHTFSTMPSYSLAEVQDLYEIELKTRDIRPATIKYYGEVLEAFYKFVDHKTPINTISLNTIQQFTQYCITERRHSAGSLSTNLRGLRAFFYWAMKQGYLSHFKIVVPKGNTEPLDTYSKEDIQRLLQKPDTNSFSEYMTWVAINILAFTGMRVSTAVNIQIGDVDFGSNIIYYRHTKNKKPHAVPLPASLKPILKQYITLRTNGLPHDEVTSSPLFCNAFGEALNGNKIYKYVVDYCKKRNVKSLGVHSFRRFYIKTMILQGVPIPKIKHLVQHSSTDLLTHYAKFYASDLEDDVNKFVADIISSGEKKRRIQI